MKKVIFFGLIGMLLVLNIGCGQDEDTDGLTVTISPSSANVIVAQTQQFTATVTGTSNTAVTWSVESDSTHGEIDSAGLYTAPETQPSPSTTTVRATSVADPSKSGTAQVTIGPSAVSQDERNLCIQITGAAYDGATMGTQAVSVAANVIWIAAELNGGYITYTGTITQTAPGADTWTYSSSPSDKMLVAYPGGPTIEIIYIAFNGYVGGTWEDFCYSHSAFEFTIELTGQYDLHITSQAQPVVTRDYNIQWSRNISGTSLFEDENMTYNLTHTGAFSSSVSGDFASYNTQDEISGTASSASADITVSASSLCYIMNNGSMHVYVQNNQFTNNSSAVLGGTTYQLQNAHVAWAAGSAFGDPGTYNVVIDTDYWVAQGVMLKAGEHWGDIIFNGSVIADSHGPDLVLSLDAGEDIFLHTLIDYP